AAGFINRDVPAYVMAAGNPAEPKTVNIEGLKRRGFSKGQIRDINRAYKTLYRRGLSLEDALTELQSIADAEPAVQVMVESIKAAKSGIIR
ncbi:MAG: acyl-[acyl-carrier-protein]--UDP-N-acetylglucosamine O-acyltransferase, partial [Porticoccaceae bacterium]|nr:acyl-[acyl-carrier-protein]--UDP-N-acetylglucosamine O-acyltransferase [Porticoccaceae bacterium]